jgi:predicted DNA-binding transcriptional regulator AlpA
MRKRKAEPDETSAFRIVPWREFTGTSDRVLRIKEVMSRTGLGRTTIWRLEREGRFPARVRISHNAVAWREHEVLAWIRGRMGRGQDVAVN